MGHFGIERTLQQLQRYYWFAKMRKRRNIEKDQVHHYKAMIQRYLELLYYLFLNVSTFSFIQRIIFIKTTYYCATRYCP